MTDADLGIPREVTRILVSEEAIYGLILVSGMIVVSNTLTGTSLNALLTVVITVVVFFVAHVYAGTIARIARIAAVEGDGAADGIAGDTPRGGELRRALVAALHHSEGMLLVAIVPIAVLLLGVLRILDDDIAIWLALVIDTLLLGVLGWLAVVRWTPKLWIRLLSAFITAALGGVLVLLKALIHH